VQLIAAKTRALEPIVAHLQPFIDRGELPDWPPNMLDVVLLGPAHEALRRWLAGAEDLAPPPAQEDPARARVEERSPVSRVCETGPVRT
jgi:hypothetical protein